MILLETILFVFLAFVVNPGRGDIDKGINGICLKTETYHSTVYDLENVQVPKKEKHWCWDPREWFKCSRTTYETEWVRVPKVLERTRTVKTCCAGYEQKKERWTFACVPLCSEGCGVHGICSAPHVCSCFPGYRGPICEEECPPGFWGQNCSKKCKCVNGGECDAEFGDCSCKPGWRGDRCESPCPAGFRGAECEEQFDCEDESCYGLTTTTKEKKTSTTEVTVTTTDIFTTESQTEENYLDMETTSTESLETTTTGTTSATETTTLEQVETTSVTETTEAFVTETTPTEGTETSSEETSTVQETISERKTLGNSFGMYRKTGLYGNKSEEVNSNKLPEQPQVPTTTVKVSGEEDAGGRENFGSDHEWGIQKPTENEERRSSRLIYFVPSLTVLSGVSVLTFLIATRWLIVRHRRKARKMAVEVEEKMFHPDGLRKCRIESIFLVNDCAEIPVYVSGSYHNDKAPVLQTFKPLTDPPTKGSDAN